METMINRYQRKLMSAMPQVKKYENQLSALTDWWGKVTLIGKINSHNLASIILEDMHDTKEKFSELHSKLINNLLLEHFKKVIVDNTAKSQVTIDILIRNLFERTADVGFLATDNDIRDFLNLNTSVADDRARLLIESRLKEYVNKYSVYDEIVILDVQGNVQANLDKTNSINICHDDLINKTLNSKDDYVETFGFCSLQPTKENSLVYSCKITENNNTDSKTIGILCLCFRFEDEMDAIFTNLSEGSNSSLLLMSNNDHVIATSNPELFPNQTHFAFNEAPQILQYQGSEYLVTSCRSNGYQGFYGLDWWSLIMTPLATAFEQVEEVTSDMGPRENLLSSKLFSTALKDIYKASKIVNDDLSLVVLNGQITSLRQKAVEFMPVLEAIKHIGETTANIFSDSVKDLQTTVVSSHMSDVVFMAELAVNIMDRNLYERANDCRWWALTSAFQEGLSQPIIDKSEQQKLSDILSYINQLYTVYTNLYLFDSNQNVIAVSNPLQHSIIGKPLNKLTGVAETLMLKNTQQYIVSSFIKTPLYENKPTYIYNAAITSSNTEKVVGGIGIVFDSEPEFLAILNDTLPKDEHGDVIQGCFALFADRIGNVIAMTEHSPCDVHEKLHLNEQVFTIESGRQHSEVCNFQGIQYILGVAASSGYREFKTTGDYTNDVLAFVFIPV